MPVPLSPAALLASIADRPACVEIRAMLREPETRIFQSNGSCAVLHPPTGLCGIAGEPDAESLAAAISGGAAVAIADPAQALVVQRLFPNCRARPARRIAFRDTSVPSPEILRHRIQVMSGGEIEALPAEVRGEFAQAQAIGEVLAACVGRDPVAFCSINWETESYCDLYVETLAGYRGRGCGAACLHAMIRRTRARGKTAVGTVEETNRQSLRMVENMRATITGRCVFLDFK
jgi:GNAT superfamily N-acetyltransferase